MTITFPDETCAVTCTWKAYSTGKIIMDFLFSQKIGVFLVFLGYFSDFFCT